MTLEWALDLREFGIRVNAVIPVECMTPLYETCLSTLDDPKAMEDKICTNISLGNRMTTSQELAAMTVFIGSEKSSHTTGQILYVDGGYTHLDRACTAK